MARRAFSHPTELELEILKVLWRQSPLTVDQMRAALAAGDAGRNLTHSSVSTMATIMRDKGLIARSKQGRAFT